MRLPKAVTGLLTLAASAWLLTGGAWAGAWPQKPRIEAYSDYDEFVRATAAYRRIMQGQEVPPLPSAVPELTPLSSRTLTELPADSPEMNDPLSEDYPPPIVVTGPEDMNDAVEKAKSFIHPNYTAPLRYNRSTSQSFPLTHAGARLLESSAVTDLLFGHAGATDAQHLLLALIHQDEMLSVERAGTYGERFLDIQAQSSLFLVPEASIDRAAFMKAGLPEVTIESFRR